MVRFTFNYGKCMLVYEKKKIEEEFTYILSLNCNSNLKKNVLLAKITINFPFYIFSEVH